MRPRKHYAIIEMGRVISIVEGSQAARKMGAYQRPFASRIEAEEFAAWWNHSDSPFASDKALTTPRDKALR